MVIILKICLGEYTYILKYTCISIIKIYFTSLYSLDYSLIQLVSYFKLNEEQTTLCNHLKNHEKETNKHTHSSD